MKTSLLGLDASTYRPHALHAPDRAWVETNCYVDLWIEVLSAWGLEPHASLGFTFALDFEGDQWLFFKPPIGDLVDLYGIDLEELAIWKPLERHVVTQLGRGRLVLVEVDAHFLPDTQGLTYRSGHSKTTIGVESIDPDARTLGYFHNAGYFALGGDDYAGLFGLDSSPLLPPYTEFVKFDHVVPRPTRELVARSTSRLAGHLARRPKTNPVTRYAASFTDDVAWLSGERPDTFHLYSFATLRQLGACFEVGASYLRWLAANGEAGLDRATEASDRIATGAKSLQFQLARATTRKKPLDATPLLAELAEAWEVATSELDSRYAR